MQLCADLGQQLSEPLLQATLSLMDNLPDEGWLQKLAGEKAVGDRVRDAVALVQGLTRGCCQLLLGHVFLLLQESICCCWHHTVHCCCQHTHDLGYTLATLLTSYFCMLQPDIVSEVGARIG